MLLWFLITNWRHRPNELQIKSLILPAKLKKKKKSEGNASSIFRLCFIQHGLSDPSLPPQHHRRSL